MPSTCRSFRNEKHQGQWRETLERASNAFGELNVVAIDTPMVIKFLTPIWRETAGDRIAHPGPRREGARLGAGSSVP